MTVHTRVRSVIYCDHTDSNGHQCCLAQFESAASEREARRSAMGEGWTSKRKRHPESPALGMVTLDLCPRHSKRA